MVNEEFKLIMFVQFLVSTSIMCFNLYLLAQKKFVSEIVESILYILCTLMQIYYYCWYGNEVKLKSLEVTDMIFGINWTSLNNNTTKILLMIMRRATIPVQFTSLYVVSVNLESFKALLKTSYSAYNLLQQTH
ncbi:odorant receptor 10-like [Colletes latitarsis]|uniref:odorant receptor 10-like n=1 Tax=Colletes latitarsis TaxID=2605962 RepID=UPI0040359F59